LRLQDIREIHLVFMCLKLRLFFLVKLVEVKTVFRSNHVSNLLPIKGTLPRDREKVLAQIEAAIPLTPLEPLPTEYSGAF